MGVGKGRSSKVYMKLLGPQRPSAILKRQQVCGRRCPECESRWSRPSYRPLVVSRFSSLVSRTAEGDGSRPIRTKEGGAREGEKNDREHGNHQETQFQESNSKGRQLWIRWMCYHFHSIRRLYLTSRYFDLLSNIWLGN